MPNPEVRKRAAFVKWFLLVALVPLLIVIVGDVPVVANATGHIVPREWMQKSMLALMVFVPLGAIFIFLPLVKLLGRSVLAWGVGIVLIPAGPFILGLRLLYLAARHQKAGAPG